MAEGPQTQPSTSSSDKSPSEEPSHHTQGPTLGVLKSRNGNNTIPSAGLSPYQQQLQDQEYMNRGPGLYAVQVQHHHPCIQHMAGFSPHTLIPFTYNLPIERSITDRTQGGGDQGLVGEVPQQHEQQAGPQGQVVRRFQIAVHVDLMLILKLIAVIFLFNQDGSRQRLAVLVFFAILIYLYQTGALSPVVRWLSQGMQRADAVQHPRPAAVIPDGQELVGEDENQQAGDGNNEGGNNWWGIAKEVKLIIFGFITSLLPGFHNMD